MTIITEHFTQEVKPPSDVMSSSSNKNKNKSSFDKYCSRLGYPNNMAKDAQSKLGNQASTSELLAAVLNNAKANNVQPNRSAQPGYLQKQVCFCFTVDYSVQKFRIRDYTIYIETRESW